jgi:hypothetical protein
MKFLLPLSLTAALLVGPAFADCVAPKEEVKIPNGSTATMDEMLAAKHAIKDNDDAVKGYADCLKNELDAKLAAGGDKMKDEEKQKINLDYANRQNAAVDKLQKLGDQFNAEVRAYKAAHPPQPKP